MGICGQFLDAANDQQRDRVIEAMGWGNDFVNESDPSCKCLVGHAEGWFYNEHGAYEKLDQAIDSPDGKEWHRAKNRRYVLAFIQFPHLCRRFGKDRIVAACKARAARGNAPTVTEIRTEIYEELTPREFMAWREGKARRLVPDGGMNGRVQ